MNKKLRFLLSAGVCLMAFQALFAQNAVNNEKIAAQIAAYKNDIRGPYKSIQWFCHDGTTRPAKEPCPASVGGVQHATYKDEVVALARSNYIFLGQILTNTGHMDFWDAGHNHSRLKQYQLGKYLSSIDNGWINQKGQFYRGAVQMEDEEAWGVNFYKWLLAKDDAITTAYFLLMQSLKDIPHKGDDDTARLMRAQSKVISDQFPKFMDLRVKIHNNPEAADVEKVVRFKNENSTRLDAELSRKIDELVAVMKKFHQPMDLMNIAGQVKTLPSTSPLTTALKTFVGNFSGDYAPQALTAEAANLLLLIRKQLINEKNAAQRLIMLDVASQLERLVFKQAALWQPRTVGGLLDKIYNLSTAAVGSGAIELWEWEQVEARLRPPAQKNLKLEELTEKLETARGLVEWGAAMVKAVYQPVIDTYAAFEPLAYGFIDDRIRSSIALQLGRSVGELGAFIARESSLTNRVMDLTNQSAFRGLNPGYALGQLVVVEGSPDAVKISGDKIYIFKRAPADLKPVAGIATVAEGNIVSHVQLLARNLGIPNAALSDENLQDLKAFNGKNVFYAVSNKGNVILKPEADMSKEEKALFTVKTRNEEKIEVPVNEIRLDKQKILNLNDVDAKDSGKLCGPKAANLGQLKEMFPDKVVEGFVIPFGIFRTHMDQPMSGQGQSYWQFLNEMFTEAGKKRAQGISEDEVENYQLRQLEILRGAIKKMPLQAEFIIELENMFTAVLKQPVGSVPVFLRSDTNMEDLKDFTGAGLNLTVFNVLEKEKIIQGIKDVWASPYTERSFKWRQKYLLNPENVFPSILVIPSVDVDYSGVMITKGVVSGKENDITVAFSRGAGGAVDGQAAESYLIKEGGGYQLISPAREPHFNSLPRTGGTAKKVATFERPILNEKNINELRNFATVIRKTLPMKTKSKYEGAYDVELGFKNDKLWLFQVRPFVENKKALGSEYLESITPRIDKKKEIQLSAKL